MKNAPLLLTVEEVITLHEEIIDDFGGTQGIRDLGLLESAVHAPAAMFGGQYLHDDLFEMAAAYLCYLVKNHAFVDGNKRIGAAAAALFLYYNGFDLDEDEPAFGDLVLAVATSDAGKKEAAEYLRSSVKPLSPEQPER